MAPPPTPPPTPPPPASPTPPPSEQLRSGTAEPMRSRWSPSSFDPAHDLGVVELDALLQAARWAPSRGNSQPWVALVVRRGGPGHDGLAAALTRGNAWVRRASAVVVMCVRSGPDPAADPGSKDARTPPVDYACYDTGQAAAHLTLQATASGLHAHQFSGMDLDAVAAVLGVPDHFRPLAGIAVGRHLPPEGPGAEDVPEDGGPSAASLAEREARQRDRRGLGVAARDGAWDRPWTERTDRKEGAERAGGDGS